MKKFIFIISLALLTPHVFSQNVNEEIIRILSEYMPEAFSQYIAKQNIARFENRKKKGYFNTTQIGMLMGNTPITERTIINTQTPWGIVLFTSYDTRTEMQISPSFTMTNGYMFNEHWAAGLGVGFEIFEWNLFPVFADIRYTLRDGKVSPFFTVKAGYSFGGFKKLHYDNLYLHDEPYYVNNVDFRNYGGLMVHPEIGMKVPISENADLLFTIAYRYQKKKIEVRQDIDLYQFDEWTHNTILNRLSLGIAIMFR